MVKSKDERMVGAALVVAPGGGTRAGPVLLELGKKREECFQKRTNWTQCEVAGHEPSRKILAREVCLKPVEEPPQWTGGG